MKARYWIILVVLIGACVLSTVHLYNSVKEPVAFELLQEIPADAQIIVIADFGEIARIIGKELFNHPQKMLDLKEKLASEQQFDEIFNSLSSAGIRYQDKLVMYVTGKDTSDLAVVSLMGIEDRKQFRQFFRNELNEKLKGHTDSLECEFADVQFLDSMKLALAWNDSCLGAFSFVTEPTKDQVVKLATTLFGPDSSKMSVDSNYIKFITAQHQVGIWVNMEGELQPGMVKVKTSPFKALSLDVRFEESLCKLEGNYHVKEGVQVEDLPFRFDIESRKPNDSAQFYVRMAMEPSDYELNQENKLIHTIDSVLELNNFSMDELLDAWNGYLDVEILGAEEKVKEFVTIEFDDDFNEVKKTTREVTPYLNFKGSMGVSSRAEQVIKKLEDKKIIVNKGDHYQFIDLFEAPVLLKHEKEHIVFSSTEDLVWQKDTSGRPVFAMNYNYKSWQKDTVWVVGKNAWLDKFIRSSTSMENIAFELAPANHGLGVAGSVRFGGDGANGFVEFLEILINMKVLYEAEQSNLPPEEVESRTN